MTRHTRNRQLKKLNSVLAFNTTGCNVPIELSNKHVCFTDLDRSFQWHRELTIFRGTVSTNRVSFNHNGEYKNIKTK